MGVRQSTLEGKALVSNRSFMGKISEVEKDGYEEFKVVEDTVITQGHCPEDFAKIVVTWGRLKLKLIDSRKDYSNEHKNIETNKTKKIESNHKDTERIRNARNAKLKKNITRSSLPCIIKEPKENPKGGWTNIPIVTSSVSIEEIDEGADILINDDNSRHISPIIEELDETQKNINYNQIEFEEIFEIFEQREDDAGKQCEFAEDKIKTTPIHLSFERLLDVPEEFCEDLFLDEAQIKEVSSSRELDYLFSPFTETEITIFDNGEENQAAKNKLKRPSSTLDQQTSNIDNLSSEIEATSSQCSEQNKKEIYLFPFLVLFIFIIFYISSSSSDNYSCFGEENEERTTSCALEGFIELSRL